MIIGVNCTNLVDKIGGLRVYFNGLFDFLLEHDRGNEYIFFFTHENLPFLDGLRDGRWRQRGIQVTHPLEITGHLKRLDLYFCPVGILEPRPVPIPSVYTLADIQDSFFPRFFSRRSLLARRIHYRSSVRMADRVITISDFSRNALIEHYRLNPGKVARVYLSAGDDFYAEPGPKESVQPDGITGRYVFYPANRWKHKNHGTLLEAIRILNEQYRDDVSLVMTGEDPENGFDVVAESQRLGIGDRVISLGFVQRHDLISLYANAVCLCYPSLFEGFGIPLVEAMALGCPVVCSNATSIPEVVGDAALKVDPLDSLGLADAVHAVITDTNVRRGLARKGRERARLFSPEKTAEGHLRVFGEAFGSFTRKRYFYHRLPFVDPVYKSMTILSWLRRGTKRAGAANRGAPQDGPQRHPLPERPPTYGKATAEILVVIPSLNQGKYLAKNLERLFERPAPEISVVLMDAGSTDGSLDVIRNYGDRFKYWRSAPDGGQSAAINEGMRVADSERYVCWVNADDVVFPERLVGLARFLDEHEACVAAHGHGQIIDERGAVIGRHYSRPFSPRVFASLNTICQPASLVRRTAWERVGGVDETLHFGMDYDLWWRLARIGRIGFVSETVAQYREHTETKTRSQYGRALKTAIDIVKRYCGYVPLLWIARLRYLQRVPSKGRAGGVDIGRLTLAGKAAIAAGSVGDFLVVNGPRGLVNGIAFILFPNRAMKRRGAAG